ncbi:hypothetical protein vseg_003433 [Gypsophila vaccaria]
MQVKHTHNNTPAKTHTRNNGGNSRSYGVSNQIRHAFPLLLLPTTIRLLTVEGLRRLPEKDLGLEVHALDFHKRFVKLWLQNVDTAVLQY